MSKDKVKENKKVHAEERYKNCRSEEVSVIQKLWV